MLTAVGTVQHGSSEYLTQWHALDVQLLRSDAPEVLGDHRDALLVSTPSHFFVELTEVDQTRVLKTAIRRDIAHPRVPLHCEVFWNDGTQLKSLGDWQWDAAPKTVSEPWLDIEIELPMEAGKLEFVSRNPIPGSASSSDLPVAWQAPWVGPKATENPSFDLPDVILLSIDTFRADALASSPQLEAFLKRGHLWTRAVSPSNWTLPSYASLFTGLEPTEHGAGRGSFAPEATGEVEERNLTPIHEKQVTLAQVFRSQGYATAMIHQSPMLESWTGFAHGFERYLRLNDENQVGVDQAKQWWSQNQGRPRFLVLQLMAPHLPYRYGPGPDPLADLDLTNFFLADHSFDARTEYFDLSEADREIVRQRYNEEVLRLDRVLAPWLAELSEQSGLVFAFHSDHGEELWDAGSFEHGHSFDDSVVRVPVAVVASGRLEPQVFDTDVPAHGVGGTLLQVSGLNADWPLRLQDSREQVVTSMPFYRASSGGRRIGPTAEETMPFRPQLHSGGRQAAISQDKMRMLEELGYMASKDLVPESSGK